jgi:hypothetical protein
MNRQQVETKAAELGYSVHKGETKFSGYLLIHDATGNKPLGNEYRLSLQDISRYLEKVASDLADINTGDDVDDIEIESSEKRKPAPTKSNLAKALEDHPDADKIKSIPALLCPDSRDRSVGQRSSHTKQEDDRIKALDHLIAVVNNPKSYEAFLQRPKEEQDRHWNNLRLALEEDERISDAKHGVTKKELTFGDMERLEEERKQRAHRQADLAFHRTSYRSRFDRYKGESDYDYRARILRELKERKNIPRPDPAVADYSTPKAPSAPAIVNVKRKLTFADITAIKAKERQQDQHTRLKEIAAALAGARKPDGRLLSEAKAILEQLGGGFYKWIGEIGISETTARRQMKAA